MSEDNSTRIYTVNLAKAWDTPKYRRTDRVINIIKEFTERHMQTNKVKIDQDLNRHIWSRGKTNPPRKIRLRMIKEDDDTVVVSSYIEEKSSLSEESVEELEVKEEKVEEKAKVQAEKLEEKVEEKAKVQAEKLEEKVEEKAKV
ncbi:MAG TPA: 50S ribosomal protein L31e, partial [Nitrososphaeraceae archaeon]|nr:50S ribosomal protein L31e [Nitrososphaeraceae archaeon]